MSHGGRPTAGRRQPWDGSDLPSKGTGAVATYHGWSTADSCTFNGRVDVESRAVEHVHASFLIAADGALSTIREQLGIYMVGPDDLADYERVEFTAPLWQLVGEHRYGLYVISRPDAAATLGPRRPGRQVGPG